MSSNYYQRNEDLLEPAAGCGLSYNQVLDISDVEESSGIEPVLTEPVTLAEAKNFCKIDVDEDDDLIENILIPGCRKECERLSNIGFVKRQIAIVQNNCNGGAFLPLGPIGEILSVTDKDFTEITDYKISGSKWKQILEPRNAFLTVTYWGGYETLPEDLKTVLLECIFFRYDERKRRENAFPPLYLEDIKNFARVW